MPPARPGPEQLLRVGRMLEQDGDDIAAVLAYREVILNGEPETCAVARRRLGRLMQKAAPGRPA